MTADYFKNATETRDKLNEISPTMCMAKWLQVSMHLASGLTQSCYHPPTHKIPLSELDGNPKALHNTVEKVKERRDMWTGKRPSGCQYCWNIEDAPDGPHLSDRHYRSSEWWVGKSWDEVIQGSWDNNINPAYVEVNFNQACNFKCTYCSPHLSTEWQKEIEHHGPYILNNNFKHNDLDSLATVGLMPIAAPNKDNPYVNAFWDWWPDLYKDLKVFRMTGGEPLMDKNTFKVFEYIVNNPNPNLELSITSNLCPPDQKLFKKFIDYMSKLEDSVTEDLFNQWKEKGYIKEYSYYAKAVKDTPWQQWPRFLIISDGQLSDVVDNVTPVIDKNQITSKFNENGLDPDSGDFLYNLIWYKPPGSDEWSCIGSKEKNKEGNNGVFLDIPRMKNFMLFVSVDSVGNQAEYIRTGLDWEKLVANVKEFLSKTKNTEITFINTFNLLSIPKLHNFLQFILDLRVEFGKQNQSLITDPTTSENKNKIKVKKHRQRVWFDIPYLRLPNWMSAQNAAFYPELIKSLEYCIKFMEDNVEDENYGKTYHGFKKYEIAKLKRDLAWIKSGITEISKAELTERKINFWKYFNQIDDRRNTNFVSTFPELSDWWNDCYLEEKEIIKK